MMVTQTLRKSPADRPIALAAHASRHAVPACAGYLRAAA